MKVGDLVRWLSGKRPRVCEGVVVGFNSKGEGGQDFVHVLVNGKIEIFMHFDLEVISGNR